MDKLQMEILTSLGQALWGSPEVFQKTTAETLAAVSLMDLTEDRALEKASTVLLQRAVREGASNSMQAHQAFYRLAPEERFILSALHQAKWSYARIARVMNSAPEQIAEIAWSSRLHLASLPGKAIYSPSPTGSRRGANCPEYDSRKPWTQRFLDEDLRPQEQVLFKSHLTHCDSCRGALVRAKNIYYQVDAQIPRATVSDAIIDRYGRTQRRARILIGAESQTFMESLGVFFRNRDVQIALVVLALLLIVSLGR